jgi:hypothetical protein
MRMSRAETDKRRYDGSSSGRRAIAMRTAWPDGDTSTAGKPPQHRSSGGLEPSFQIDTSSEAPRVGGKQTLPPTVETDTFGVAHASIRKAALRVHPSYRRASGAGERTGHRRHRTEASDRGEHSAVVGHTPSVRPYIGARSTLYASRRVVVVSTECTRYIPHRRPVIPASLCRPTDAHSPTTAFSSRRLWQRCGSPRVPDTHKRQSETDTRYSVYGRQWRPPGVDSVPRPVSGRVWQTDDGCAAAK